MYVWLDNGDAIILDCLNRRAAMTKQQTPELCERWRIHIDSTGTTYLMVGSEIVGEMHGHRDQKERDASRIVLCVNACAGIDTEILERHQSVPSSLVKAFAMAEQQRDEMLAAMKLALDCITNAKAPLSAAAILREAISNAMWQANQPICCNQQNGDGQP